ncbi:MAG: SMP-30/gluconolactonase/LRE family protein [Bacteroidetes bacterium]|nr:SMP-30/gluconolactonase/LRE family protein [Fibrella sp.]
MEEAKVLATGLSFPDGTVFDLSGRLWCAEQTGGGLFCLHTDGQTERIPTGGRPGGLKLDYEGNIWFCDAGQNAIRRFNPDTRHVETIVDSFDGKPLNYPNDLVFDRAGNLIFTCPGPLPDLGRISLGQGTVLVLTEDGSVQVVADELHYPNGLAFIPGSDTLLITETQKQRIWCGFWDVTTPSWDTITVWATTGNVANKTHGPDGLTFGPDGNIYAAIFGMGVVNVFDPDGLLLRAIPVPGQRPISCIFDPGGQFLIVSETERGELIQLKI